MLSYLSTKFKQEKREQSREPRAVLFLNRFTEGLTIMYATSGIEKIVGISSGDIRGHGFYHCITENCLEHAVKCLETAQSNNSIAYLRYRFRSPLQTTGDGVTTAPTSKSKEYLAGLFEPYQKSASWPTPASRLASTMLAARLASASSPRLSSNPHSGSASDSGAADDFDQCRLTVMWREEFVNAD